MTFEIVFWIVVLSNLFLLYLCNWYRRALQRNHKEMIETFEKVLKLCETAYKKQYAEVNKIQIHLPCGHEPLYNYLEHNIVMCECSTYKFELKEEK